MADGYYEEQNKYQKAGFIIGEKKKDGYRYGYINNEGKTILEPQYNEIERVNQIEASEGIYLLAARNGQVGVYKNTKQIIKHSYEEVEYDAENAIFITQKNNNQKKFNKFGEEIIENKEESKNLENAYSYIEYAYNSYFIVTKDGKASVFDENKSQNIISGYNVIEKIQNTKVIQAIENDTIELYNENMEKIATMENGILSQEGNYIKLYSNTQRKYFDINGKELKNTEVFPDLQLYAFEEKGKWGFKDKNENTKLEPIYDMVTELNPYGFAGIRKNGKWGVVNSKGEIILEPIYEIEWNEPEFIGKYCKVNSGYGIIYYTKDL